VECHEIWEFNDQTRLQKLTGVIALCPKCHMVKHIGLAQRNGKYVEAVDHFCKVNKVDRFYAEQYIRQAFYQWQNRSIFEWILNIDWLLQKGLRPL